MKYTDEELLAEAKLRYPIGTIIDCPNNNAKNQKVESYNVMPGGKDDIYGIFTDDNCWICLSGKWAKIIKYKENNYEIY